MPLVSVKLGLTLPVPSKGGGYSYVRVDEQISDIDTAGDIQAQIEESVRAAEEVAAAVERLVAKRAANISSFSFEGFQLADELKRLKNRLNSAWPKLVADVKEQGEIIAGLTKAASVDAATKRERTETHPPPAGMDIPHKLDVEKKPRRRKKEESDGL